MRSKISHLRNYFYFDEAGRPNINQFGIYRLGLTGEEVNIYLQVRAGRCGAKKLSRRFWKLFGWGTRPLVICRGESIPLVYRHDVERFADAMFIGLKTYFD